MNLCCENNFLLWARNAIPRYLVNFITIQTINHLLFFLRKLAKVNPAMPPPTIIIFLNIFDIFRSN